MPSSGTEATSSVQRHGPTHIHPSSQVNLHGLHHHSLRNSSPLRSDCFFALSSGNAEDVLDSTRASSSRTRWNVRTAGSPYGPRPVSRRGFLKQKHSEAPGTVISEGAEKENELPGSGGWAVPADEEVRKRKEADEDEEIDILENSDRVRGEAGPTTRARAVSDPSPFGADAGMREENNLKAGARANARNADNPEVMSGSPHDLLASISRIANLINSLNPDAPDNGASKFLQDVHDALSDGGALPSAPWQAELIQSLRRVESLLGRMEKLQTHEQVTPAEIEALKLETAQLELQMRVMVEPNPSGRTPKRTKADGSHKDALQTEVTEALCSPQEREGDAEPSSCPSDYETDLTGSEPEDSSSQEDVSLQELPLLATTPAIHTSPMSGTSSPLFDSAQTRHSNGATTTSPVSTPAINSLALSNLNLSPEPPQNPVEYLQKTAWTMAEALLLLEVVANYPPAEHGWNFIAEVYNNLIIWPPLREWFSKQAALTNEEDKQMITLLKNMATEARQLRAPNSSTPGSANARAAASNGTTAATKTAKVAERGQPVSSSSSTARAEASASARNGRNGDAYFFTQLPIPLEKRGPPGTTPPPPAQRFLPLPRPRPPITLPSAQARALSALMRTSRSTTVEYRALFTMCKPRFPPRTPWDCWHRWCTPWIGTSAVASAEGTDEPLVVQDYICGNLVYPCVTWKSVGQENPFDYRPVRGTYPQVAGVQHTLTGGFDPRPGMAAFARMAHYAAEKAWAAAGLGRLPDLKVSAQVLARRRAVTPPTLSGLWPGKASFPPKSSQTSTASAQASQQTVSAAAPHRKPVSKSPPLLTPAVLPTPPTPVRGTVKVDGPLAPSLARPVAGTSGTPRLSTPENRTAPPPSQSATPPPSFAPISSGTPQGRQANTSTSNRPSVTYHALPKRYQPPARSPPRVPDGTLGSTMRPGMSAWFEQAAVRMDVLERLGGLPAKRKLFDQALGAPPVQEEGAEGKRAKTVQEEGDWDDAWDCSLPGGRLPHHLKLLAIPPPPPRPCAVT
ncbi:hypothetical protein C8Q80DRAFT_1274641 [Daedaleopsis nitida]|nr:hypothetical protein C8Q80DRAFT_1274641 [Daedaleopsis nitida]